MGGRGSRLVSMGSLASCPLQTIICGKLEKLWRTILLLPFKLVTVFLHEASHAIACKLTCGHVEAIQVNADEGGFTQTRGGVYWVILPAGYLGSAFWGMVLILASTNLLTARIAAGCFAFALLVVLFVAKNWTLRGLCIGFIILLGVIWVLQETTKIRILRYIILFIGVMNSLFSVYDIYDQLIMVLDGVLFGDSYLFCFFVDPCTLAL
ncbi:uncharacterized protein LOC114320756 isoform X3 [Camellia sinensis]|uniref:uncharacterized protein LOC114320756 isoform X3 n=1 Tax=Camellia sinensis TaxID=4442 RepID=UPI00103676ED|nr:uncharacterized protein LOC114320756 isoform X3 [Camellia sinensis]